MIENGIAFKSKLVEFCQGLVAGKIGQLQSELNAIQLSANEETKSTVGDKYETGRAMAMLEKEKVASQLLNLEKQRDLLTSLKKDQICESVELGSLVITKDSIFFVSCAFGLVTFESRKVFLLSPLAPVAKALAGKKAGDTVPFQNRLIEIEEVY